MSKKSFGQVRALVVGESWIKHTIHMKGFDHFHSTEYEEGAGEFLKAISDGGIDVTYTRGHEVSSKFPTSMDDLQDYDVVVISDVGANTFLLTDDTFLRSRPTVNRLSLLAEYVHRGGGMLMVGGYLSFTGIDGRGRYGMSPLADVLPVKLLDHDDRIEVPEGAVAELDLPDHDALGDTPAQWPVLLGYNRVVAKPDTEVIARYRNDPLLVVGTYGAGRVTAFTSDLASHWAPPEFLAWDHYQTLWVSLLSWTSGRYGAGRGSAKTA
ncbi:cytoplasmic protein [Mycobacterium saskatchewanense]|uniref:Cytoplasmic protein n=2 Tax=Mycobacterium saskatchewanense TaxID=220927 RepID=A0AAJ3TST1_9MYCO|nr:glutamine amidotransferase [Mycobacterium saskatchewanense]ORW64096.1 cytoplasmic protein [Mycobacterium saskatchewanense]